MTSSVTTLLTSVTDIINYSFVRHRDNSHDRLLVNVLAVLVPYAPFVLFHFIIDRSWNSDKMVVIGHDKRGRRFPCRIVGFSSYSSHNWRIGHQTLQIDSYKQVVGYGDDGVIIADFGLWTGIAAGMAA